MKDDLDYYVDVHYYDHSGDAAKCKCGSNNYSLMVVKNIYTIKRKGKLITEFPAPMIHCFCNKCEDIFLTPDQIKLNEAAMYEGMSTSLSTVH